MFKSLSSRISFLVFSIVISFNLVLMTIFYLALEKKSKEHFKKSIDTITNSIPNYYQIPLWNLDTKVIMEITEAFLKDKTIKGIQVIDIDSSILYQKFSDGDNATSLFNTPLIEIRKIPIIHTNSNSLGIIQVFFSSKNYHDENRAIILRMITVFSLFSFLIVFALYYILNNFLRNPLVILLKAIASTEETQYSVRIHQNFPAELGQIATEFNKAMEKVQESENKLLSQNQNLEYLVSERTHQLDEQRAQMINSSRLASLGEFSAGISHEINNPLAVIHGNSRILLNHINSGKLDRQFEGPISKIKLMTERIQKIIKNLRTFARDGEKDEKQLFEIAKFIDEIHLLAKVKLDKSQIAFEFLNLSSLTHLYGQEVPLSQVIINLINNSADAISEQNEKWVKVSIEKDNHSAVIKITDSGHGIPATIQTKMMNPFFTTKEVGKGTGLGLSISLGIIKNHGGEFYYNKEAKNTQFIIKLPINEHLSQAI